MKILISGGAGFIGSRLTEKLIEKNYEITILDNFSEQVHGDKFSSPLYKRVKGIARILDGDVRSKSDWKKAIKNQDYIIHLASETGTGQSMYNIERYNSVNVVGTAILMDTLLENKNNVKKIILASSRAIYGEGKYTNLTGSYLFPNQRDEKDLKNGYFEMKCKKSMKQLFPCSTDEKSRLNANSIYALTKVQQEKILFLMGKVLNVPVICLRFQNVYGPGQSLLNPYTGILSVFSTNILNGNPIEIYEDGKQTRDFVFIDDTVSSIILSLESNRSDNMALNVGSGTPISVLEVAQSLIKKYKSTVEIRVSGKYRMGDIRHNYADLKKIKKLLNFTPKINFNKGVTLFTDWVLSQSHSKDKYSESVEELKKRNLIR